MNHPYPWAELCPPKFITPNRMQFGGGAFERQIGLDDVMRGGPHDEISAPTGRDTRELPHSLSHYHGSTWQEGGSLQARKRALTRTDPLILDFQAPEQGDINVCRLRDPACDILSEQPEL